MTVPPEVALAAYDAGLSVVRASSDGSKRPAGQWKQYQAERPDRSTVEGWFPHPGIGIVCGAVSGGLEMLEFEGRAVAEGVKDQFLARCADHDLGPLVDRIVAGYAERTPSGGIHLLYRCDTIAGNLKLARRPATTDELEVDPADKVKVLIETRGEGGFVVVAPSNGTTHPSGKAWQMIAGGFDTIATITPEEREALFAVARSFDDDPEPPAPPPIKAAILDEQTPLQWFDENTTCDEVLERAGFTYSHEDRKAGRGAGKHYTRPGKDRKAGTSATVWLDDGTATLFSTSISAPGEYVGNRNLRPSQLAAALLHGGDHSSLAREIAGDVRYRPRQATVPTKTVDTEDLPEPTPLPGLDGSTPPFPLHVFPDWIAEPVAAIADGLQVGEDLPATVALGCLATVTQGKVRVTLPGSAWTEWTNLFLAVAAPPGAGKSPAYKPLTKPLKVLEEERQDAAKVAQREAEGRLRILEGKAKAEEAKAVKGDPGAEMRMHALRQEADELEVPKPHQDLADDATPEALADLIAANGGRLAVLSAEGQVFDAMAGQYVDRGGKANLDVYLKGFSGDSLRQNRVKRDAVVIDECLLTICVTTQPAVLESLSAAPQLAARGATARFMYAVPAHTVGTRDRSKVFSRVDTGEWSERLLAMGRRFGANETPLDISLDPELVGVWTEWDQALEARCAPGRDLALLAEWVQKLRSCVLRVAGLLAVALDRRTIDADVLERAFTIGHYWTCHAKAVHAMWGVESPDLALAKRILSWVQRTWLPAQDDPNEPLTARVIHRAMFKQVTRVEDLEVPLTTLVEHGWLLPLDGLPIQLGLRGQSVRFRCVSHVNQAESTKGDEMSKGVGHVAVSRGEGEKTPSSSYSPSRVLPATADMDDTSETCGPNDPSDQSVDMTPLF